MQLTRALHKGMRECPQSPALTCGDRSLTYADLAHRAARFAAVLRGLGVAPGDRVGMMSMNSAQFVEFFYGTWWAGGIVNPVNIRWSAQEVAYSLDDCDTRVLIVDDAFADVALQLRGISQSLVTVVHCGSAPTPEGMLCLETLMQDATEVPDASRSAGDLAAVMYTGGTTGKPKGVMLTHANLYLTILSNLAAITRKPKSRALVNAPLFHIGACILVLIQVHRLAPIVVVPAFDELSFLRTIEQHRIEDIFLVPTMIKRVIEHPRFADFDLASVDLLFYGASPIDATLLRKTMAALPGVRFAQAYGMTELAPTLTILGPEDHLAALHQEPLLRSAGRPVPIAEVCVLDPEGRECAAGVVGEICARGPMVMQGYWNKPSETAEALRGGWMHTGDGGMIDGDGYLYVVDRIKDMIVTGGENVYSAEVENAIAGLPEVLMCAVIGVPDERWGERVHACIVLRDGMSLTQNDVMAHCRSRIAGYKSPRSVEFTPALPLTAAGKIQKTTLREPYWSRHTRRVG